jgi:hypothetical protein
LGGSVDLISDFFWSGTAYTVTFYAILAAVAWIVWALRYNR